MLLLLLCEAAPALADAPKPVLTVKPASEPARSAGRPAAKKKPAKGGTAQEPAEEDENGPRPISIAMIGGYGVMADEDAADGVNPFGIGFGVLGGYTVDRVYLGTRFLFFLGQKRGRPDSGERSADEWLVGLEGGYTQLKLGPLRLLSEVGFGLAFSSSESVEEEPSAEPEPIDTSSTDPYIELGIALQLDVSRELFFGLQGRAVLVLAKQAVDGDHSLIALPLLGTIGMRF